MRKFLFTIFVPLLLITGCSKEDLGLPAPLLALTESGACGCDPFIDEYVWKGETVYIYSCRGPNCNCMVLYYDQEGELFSQPTGYRFEDFLAEASFVRNVWTCD